MNAKLGKNADDIFAKPSQKEKTAIAPVVVKPTEEEASKETPVRGRPLEHKENWSKVTVVLLDKQIHWLDQLASTIRLNTKAAVSRAELIRAAIAAIEESEIDLSNIGSEKAIKNLLLEKLKR